MNVAAHQDKDKEIKTGKRRQAIDFKETAFYPSAGSFRGQHSEKMVCVRGEPGVTGIVRKANSHFDPTQTGLGIVPPR